LHWFLYILECICQVFISMSGGTNKPMVTTGEMVRGLDIFVGICGFFLPIIIIIGIIYIVKLCLKIKNSKNKNREIDTSKKDNTDDNKK